MDPISNANGTSLDEPTPAELEAGACLPREPEPLASRHADGPAPAVKAHYIEGTTTERGSMSWGKIKEALLRAILP